MQDAYQQVNDRKVRIVYLKRMMEDHHQAGGPDEQVEGGGHRGRGAAQCEEAISREDG